MSGKRFIAVPLALLLSLSAVGCSAPNEADTDAVKAAMDKFRACSSFTIAKTAESVETVNVDGVQHVYSVSNETVISYIAAPVAQMKSVTTSNIFYDGEQGLQVFASYVIPENGGYAEYVSDGSAWYKITTDDASVLSEMDAYSVADIFVNDISFRKAGEDSLDSGKALRYEGKLSGEKLVSMLDIHGLLSSIASMSENQQSKIRANLTKDLSDLTVSVWVDEAEGYPVRFEVNFTEILKDIEESIAKTLGGKSTDGQWAISRYAVIMTAGDFDAVEELVLPPEAASAQPYEAAAGTGA